MEGIPDLGGAAFFYEWNAELTAIRIAPPPLGPHSLHRRRREETELDKRTGNMTIAPLLRAEDRRGAGKRGISPAFSTVISGSRMTFRRMRRGKYRGGDRGRPRSRKPDRSKEAKPKSPWPYYPHHILSK